MVIVNFSTIIIIIIIMIAMMTTYNLLFLSLKNLEMFNKWRFIYRLLLQFSDPS